MIGAAAVVVLAGLKAAQTLVIPFLLALFLAIICFPVVAWLTSRKVPVGLAVVLVVVVLLAAFSGFGAIVGGSVKVHMVCISTVVLPNTLVTIESKS